MAFLQPIKQEVAIRNCPEVELRQGMGYCIMLTGLSAQNMPSKLESDVLSQFVRDNYPDYTPEEFKYAMEKGMARRFDPEVDVKVYGSFSCEYIGRILSAYEAWQGAGERIIMEGFENYSCACVNAVYRRFLKGSTNEYYSKKLYQILVDVGLISELGYRLAKRVYPRIRAIRRGFEWCASHGLAALYETVEEPNPAIWYQQEEVSAKKMVY
jgi:hypothetical protein